MQTKEVPAIVEEKKEESTWEDYVALGIEARENKDNSQWILGDLANEVCESRWGGDPHREHTIKAYAKEIGLNEKTLQEYARIARIFDGPERVKQLSFRHHQLVSKFDDASTWLNKAHDNGWSCERLQAETRNEKPRSQEEVNLEEEFKKRVFFSRDEKVPAGLINISYNPNTPIDEEKITYKTTIRSLIKVLSEAERKFNERNKSER